MNFSPISVWSLKLVYIFFHRLIRSIWFLPDFLYHHFGNNFSPLKIFNTVILLHFSPKRYLFCAHIKPEIIHICMNVYSECESAKHVMSISSIHYILHYEIWHSPTAEASSCLFLLLETTICSHSFLLSPRYLPSIIFFLCGYFLWVVSIILFCDSPLPENNFKYWTWSLCECRLSCILFGGFYLDTYLVPDPVFSIHF